MKRKLNMSVKTLIALALGVGAGLLLQDHKEAAAAYIGPFGTLFLNLSLIHILWAFIQCACKCETSC